MDLAYSKNEFATGRKDSSHSTESYESDREPVQHETSADSPAQPGASVAVPQPKTSAVPAQPESQTAPPAKETPRACSHAEETGEAPVEQKPLETSELVIADRLRRLPLVRCGVGAYERARASSLLAPPLGALECGASLAAMPWLLAGAACGRVCRGPVAAADWLLCRGLDALEALCPCVAAPPAKMCGVAKDCVVDTVCWCPRKVKKTTVGVFEKLKSN